MNVRTLASAYCPPFLRPALARLEASPLGMRLVSGTFWSVAGAVVSRGLMLMASILVARILGQEVYGEYGMIRSTVNMFVIFAGFGLGVTATKHVAEFRRSDPERAGRIIALSGTFALGTSVVVATAVLFCAPWLAAETINAPHLAPLLRIGAFILLVNGLNGAQTGALSGFEAFRTIAKVNLWVGLASFPLLVSGAYLGGLEGTVWALLFTMVFHWLLNHLALRTLTREQGVLWTLRDCLQEWPILWNFSLPGALAGFMVAPVLWACNALLVNQPGGYAQMGIFGAAEQWRAAILFVPGMIAGISLPMLSSLHGRNDAVRYRKLLKYNVIINTGASAGIAIPIALLAPWIMRSYGEDFAEGYWVLICLAVSAVLVAVNGVVGRAIASRGKMWIGLAFNMLWAVSMLGLSYWFVNLGFGALGLAGAYLLAYILHSSWQSAYVFWWSTRSPSQEALSSLP